MLGGILVPLRWRGSRRWPASNPNDWLWPTVVCIPAAIVASVVRIPTRVAEAAGEDLPRVIDFSPGETEEYALAAMLMLYLLSIHKRLANRSAAHTMYMQAIITASRSNIWSLAAPTNGVRTPMS